MIKASALYTSVIVSLIIALIISTLITVAYFYRSEYLKNQRYNHLSANLQSGINILLSESPKSYKETKVDLFGEEQDSLILSMDYWGIYQMGVVKSFVQKDTLNKVFFIGTDTQKDQDVLYFPDENRPLSLSGSTAITGKAYLPEAGIRTAFVNGKPYYGKELVKGEKHLSKPTLPGFNRAVYDVITSLLTFENASKHAAIPNKMNNSFYNSTQTYFSGTAIGSVEARGNIVIVSDTVVTILRNAVLNDVILCAPAFIIEDGFNGNCQIFARDSIVTGNKVELNYPSVLGIIKAESSKLQPKISLGRDCRINGVLFTYENKSSTLKTLIRLGKNTKIDGEIYSSGFIQLQSPVTINGKVSCNRFIIETPETLYENYLIDIELNRPARNKYYLSSPIFDSGIQNNKILKWVN